jgi:uncharacterized Zn finger protein
MSITEANLLELAGPGAFDRGCEYYREGRVVELEMQGDRTLGIVDGTTLYRVELLHERSGLDGSCNCPASDHIVFCKHCVATALAIRDQLANSVLAARNDADNVLRDYLDGLDVKTLVSHLMTVVHKDPALYERLRTQALFDGEAFDVSEIKKTLTRATPLKDVFDPASVRAFFGHLTRTLQGIGEIAEQLPAADLLNVALHAIRRLDKSLERVDDSYGYRFEPQGLSRELHNKALQRSAWQPAQRAEHLLEMALNDPWDQFAGAPFNYVEGLGEEGMEAFFRLVDERLAALPRLSDDATYEDKVPYLRLSRYLRARAEQAEDWDGVARLDELTATTAIDFERIAALNLKAGKPESAAEWLARADAIDDGGRSSRYALWSEVHAELGDWNAAVSAREAAFRRNVNFGEFQRLMYFADQARDATAVRDSVVEFLQTADRPGIWPDELHAFTLAQILREEDDYEGMANNAVTRIERPDRLLQVADWLAGPAPKDAASLYEKAANVLIAKKTNRCYRSAVRTLFAAKPVFEACSAGAFEDCLGRIRDMHYRKRNLMAEIDKRLGKG